MRNSLLHLLLILLFANVLHAQTDNVGIGTTTPDPSAALDIQSTDKGLRIPSMTTAQRDAIASPATGLVVFDTEENSFFYWDGIKWFRLGVPTDGELDQILRSDATGNASWQPLIDTSYLPAPAPALSGSLAIGSNPLSVAVQDGYAYVVDAGSQDLKVIDVSDPASPTLSGSLAIGSYPISVAVQGSYAYVVDAGSVDLKVIDVSDPASPTLSGSLAIGGYPQSVAVQGNYAYVVDSYFDDLKVIDVSDPASPTLSGSLAIGSIPISVAVQGSFAYVVDQGSQDLKVIDVSDPASPTLSGSLAIGSIPISVAVQGSFAYVVDDSSDDLKVINVSDPANPTLSGSLNIGADPKNIAVQGSYAYVQGNSNLQIINVFDPANPTLSEIFYTGSGSRSVAVQGSYAYVVNYNSDELKVIKLSGTAAVGMDLNGELVPYTETDGDPTNELQDWSNLPGIPAGFSDDTDDVDDADADPNNELITGATLNGTDLEITDAGGTMTVDLSSLAGSESTTVTDGNTVDLTLTGVDISAETILDPDAANILSSSAAGLKATESDPEVGANTTNYLPKWDGSALVQSSSVFEDGSGNVGIGTTTPAEKLDVNGNIRTDGLTLPTGAALDYVLKSDANGQASWQPLIDTSYLPAPAPALSGSLAIGTEPRSVAVQGSYAYVVDSGSEDLKVIDVSDPASPTLSGSLAIGSNSWSVAVQGSFAYVVDNFSDDLKVIDVSDPASPTLSGSLAIGSFPRSVAVQGSFAYVVDSDSDDLKVIDVSDPANPTLSGSLAIGSFPRSVAVQGSFAYVVDSDSDDLKVIDVSDPASPTLSGSLAIGSIPISVAVQGNYAYVADDGSDDLKVIDVSDPASPTLSGSLDLGAEPKNIAVQGSYAYVQGNSNLKIINIFDPTNPTLSELFHTGSGSQFVAVQGSYAYVVKASSDDLKVIKLSGTAAVGMDLNGELVPYTETDGDPTNELITTATLNGTDLEITDAGGTMTVDLSSIAGSESTTVTDGNTVDLTLTGADISAETILDPDAANILSSSAAGLKATESDPEVGANTTNYLPKWDGSALVQSSSVFEDGSGKVGIGTTTPAEKLDVNGNIRTDGLTLPTGAALDYVLKSDANGQASWQSLIDASYLPAPTALIGSLISGLFPESVAVQGSFAYVVDSYSDDLKAIDVSDPASPTLSGSLAIGSDPRSMAVQGNYAYVVDWVSHDLKVIDVSDPTSPTLSGSLAIGTHPQSVAVQGSFAYVVDNFSDDLKVIDVSDPANPTLSGSLTIGSNPISVAVQGNYAYVADDGSVDLKVIDVSDPASPTLSGSLAIGSNPQSVAVQGSFAYVVDIGSEDLKVIDVSDPASPTLSGSLAIGGFPTSLAVQGSFAYVVDIDSDDLKVIDVSDPANPILIEIFYTGTDPNSLAVLGSYAYVVNYNSGELMVLKLSSGMAAVGMNINGELVPYTETDPEVGVNTTNYLPKWDGSALVASTSVFEDGSGQVGIGTITPDAPLSVKSPTAGNIIPVIKVEKENCGAPCGQPEPTQGIHLQNISSSLGNTIGVGFGDFGQVLNPSAWVGARLNDKTNHYANLEFMTKGADSLNTRMVINSAGNVGIGQNNPSTTLDVNGTVTATAFAGDGSALTGINVNDADADATNELITGAALNGTDLEITDAGGTMTVDLSSLAGDESTTVTDGNTIDLTLTGADISAETILDPDAANILSSSAAGLKATESDPEVGANTTNYLPKWDGSALVASSSVFEDGSGNVGIGTNAPEGPLHVELPYGVNAVAIEQLVFDFWSTLISDMWQSFTTTFDGRLTSIDLATDITGTITLSIYEGTGTAGTLIYSESKATPFTTSMNSPWVLATPVDLMNGTVYTFRIHDGSSAYFGLALDDPYAGGQSNNGTSSDYQFKVEMQEALASPVQALFIASSGDVGIGRSPATNKLEVEGNASKSSAGDWLANSDARLKKNIQALNSEEILQKMLSLQGVTYEWNDTKTGTIRPEGTMYGFTAQNIQQVFPELVEEDNLGFLQTAYGTYDAMYVEAIRALKNENDELRAKCEAQNAELEDLKNRFEKIEAVLMSTNTNHSKIIDK